MFAMAVSCALRGISGIPVAVEADISSGLPSFTIVGLTDRAIQEARERVRAAIKNGGFEFPQHRLTVNLAPAELPKEGTSFDLPIALATLRCGGLELDLVGTAVIGELALDASVRPVAGVLAMARSLRAEGIRRLVVGAGNAAEAALVEGIQVVGVHSLGECVAHLDGSRRLGPSAASPSHGEGSCAPPQDLAAIHGQLTAKRALEISAAGGHNLLLMGPPGSGKTMLARAFGGLLPDLGVEDALDVAAVHSLRGVLRERQPTSARPPFRAPHHSISRAGLIGGGAGLAQPGEASMAHRGVLFLDELCEFPRAHLEALRQPLEERSVTIARARGSVTLPAAFALVAAANPCPCGHEGDPRHRCDCTSRELSAYRARLSGPVRDRIDLSVSVPRQPYSALFGGGPAEPTAAVRSRVVAARECQLGRGATLNAALDGAGVLSACSLDAATAGLLEGAGERLGLSGRGYHRVLRVARTIADLAGERRVGSDAVLEALRLRGSPGQG